MAAVRCQRQMEEICCGSAEHISSAGYDREKALRYAYRYSYPVGVSSIEEEYLISLIIPGFRNGEYNSYPGNCANFVSQVLHEGGFAMNGKWHSERRLSVVMATAILGILSEPVRARLSDTTNAWTVASDQFDYISDPSNGFTSKSVVNVCGNRQYGQNTTKVSYSDLSSQISSLGIQAGDAMYSYNEAEGVHHASIVSKVKDGKIYYSANSLNRYDNDLAYGLRDNDGVLIVRINDAA